MVSDPIETSDEANVFKKPIKSTYEMIYILPIFEYLSVDYSVMFECLLSTLIRSKNY